jgi:hypothetical protein
MKKITFLLVGFIFSGGWQMVAAQTNDESGVIYCESHGISRPLSELAEENPINLKKLERQNLKKMKDASGFQKTKNTVSQTNMCSSLKTIPFCTEMIPVFFKQPMDLDLLHQQKSTSMD